MPILYHVNDIESDMNLGGDFYDEYKVVLPKGWQLSPDDVSYLKNETPEKYASIASPVFDSVISFEDQSSSIKMSLEARKHAFDAYKKITGCVVNRQEITHELIKDIRSNLAKALTLVQFNPIKTAILSHLNYGHNYETHLAVNSLFLSLLIGNKIKHYIKEIRSSTSYVQKIENPESLTPLTISAFYRDISMISRDSLWQKTSLTEYDKREFISHPVKTSQLLAELISPQSRQAISHHHENFNGTGFPERISGEKINIFARIIRVADAYCTGISVKNDGTTTHPAVVLHEMLHGNQKEYFDPEVARGLAAVVQPFAIGSKLTLSNGKAAIVSGHTAGEPFLPTIVITHDARGELVPRDQLEKPVDMVESTYLKIKSVNGQDVSCLYSQEVLV